jgi:hypothetical protein
VQSGVRLGSATSILTVGIDDASTLAAIQGIGLPVMRVRYALPACERIRVNRPIVVVIGATIRAVDVERVATAAAQVDAQVVEIGFIGKGQLRIVLGPIVEAILAEQDVPQRLIRA